MPTTPTLQLPYPANTDAPAGPTQIQALAAAIDAYLAPAHYGLSNTATMGTWTTANQTYPVTSYDTTDKVIGDLTYSAGVITVHTAGVYRWDATLQLPAASTGYRVRVYVTVNGTRDARGEVSMNFAATNGAQFISIGYQRWFAAGDQLQVAGECSAAALVGVQPLGFAVSRLFVSA